MEKYQDKEIIRCAGEGDLEAVKKLIDLGVDVNTTNSNYETALIRASKNNHLEVVKYLIASGANINVDDTAAGTPLGNAVNKENVEVMKVLIKCGANIPYWVDNYGDKEWYKEVFGDN